MSYNKLKEIGSNSFRGLSELETLYLDNNQLENLDAELFKDLDNLRNLFLNRNNLRAIESYTFNGLVGLKVLNLDGNKIEYMQKNWLECLEKLEELSLRNRKLKDKELSNFKRNSSTKFDCCEVAVSDSELKCPICDESASVHEWGLHIIYCKEDLVAAKNRITELENQLKAQFKCKICWEEVTQNNAKTLQCGHVMHATCLDRLPKEFSDGKHEFIKCPGCRQMSWPIKLY